MQERPYLRELLRWGIGIAIALLIARYAPPGTPIPPLPIPGEPPTMPQPPAPRSNVKEAISRIQFGNSGCTATPIGQRRGDGRYWVLTAAHCVQGTGQRGRLTTQRGDQLTVTVHAVDRGADCAWLLTDSTSTDIPFAELADTLPQPGTRIWHSGYGVHIPGNREDGVFVGGPTAKGQLQFQLSVSNGDSGGAIVVDESGRVLSCVCCTTGVGVRADVWGAGPTAIRQLQQGATDDLAWTPIPIPIVGPDGEIPKKMP